MKSSSYNLAFTLAAVSIVIFLLSAIFEGGMMVSMIFGFLAFAFIVLIPVIFIRKERTLQGGFITFKEAFTLSFTGLLLGGVIATLFTFVYVTYIDSEYVDRMAYRTMEFTKNMMEGNVPEAQMEETLMKIETDMAEGFSPFGMLKSFGIYILVYLVISAVLAAFLKKERTGDSLDAKTI